MDSETQNRKAELDQLVKQYQALTKPDERTAFYHANPRLAEVFSALNHPPAAATLAAPAETK